METVLRIARSHVIAWSAMKLAWKTNVDAASRIATAPAKLVDAQPAARWIQRLQAVAAISEFNISPAPLVLIDLVFVVIFLALLVASSGWLAAVPLASSCSLASRRSTRDASCDDATAERMVAEAKIRDFLIEALNGIVTVKALGTEQQILRRFERLSEQAAGCTQMSCVSPTMRRASGRWSRSSRRSPPPRSAPSWPSTARSPSASWPAAPCWPGA